jgi:putative ABC transport system permease protein
MNTKDLITETFSALLSNKVRTSLTMLGIVIGIGSVIAMVSIGQGAQASIESSIQSIGANLIMITPGSQRSIGGYGASGQRGSAKTLLETDAEAITKEISGIKNVALELSGRYQITAKGTNTNTSVIGTTPSYATVRNVQVAEGGFISDQHIKTKAKVAVIGPTTSTDLFGEEVSAIGQNIRINGMQFKIVGITVEKGGSGFGSSDDIVYIPFSTAEQFLFGGNYVTSIDIEAESADNMATIQEDITTLLRTRHGLNIDDTADFSIMNQNDIVETASSITGTFTILLGAIAGISLVVGGIGIMNMMLTTVTERTREIGLRKAIGAKRKDINKQFLAEAIALTVIGGILGIILGSIISLIITYTGLLTTKISFNSILLAFSVSAAIGIAFGYYPARKASIMNPIDALRYE